MLAPPTSSCTEMLAAPPSSSTKMLAPLTTSTKTSAAPASTEPLIHRKGLLSTRTPPRTRPHIKDRTAASIQHTLTRVALPASSSGPRSTGDVTARLHYPPPESTDPPLAGPGRIYTRRFLPSCLSLPPPTITTTTASALWRSSEGHELKLPLGLPLGHPHRVGGVLRHLHDADGERLISLVDMVSHYLAGEGRETTRGG